MTTEELIGKLLCKGVNATVAAERLSLSRKWVFLVAAKNYWPTNPLIVEGGALEAKIYDASEFCTIKELSRMYRTAIPGINRILARVSRQRQRHYTDAKLCPSG